MVFKWSHAIAIEIQFYRYTCSMYVEIVRWPYHSLTVQFHFLLYLLILPELLLLHWTAITGECHQSNATVSSTCRHFNTHQIHLFTTIIIEWEKQKKENWLYSRIVNCLIVNKVRIYCIDQNWTKPVWFVCLFLFISQFFFIQSI